MNLPRLLACSCLLSFISIPTTDSTREQRAERLADCLFLAALLGIVVTTLRLIFRLIR